MLLQHMGLLEQQTRKSTKGEIKRYWSITADGRKWGKNITSPTNPRGLSRIGTKTRSANCCAWRCALMGWRHEQQQNNHLAA